MLSRHPNASLTLEAADCKIREDKNLILLSADTILEVLQVADTSLEVPQVVGTAGLALAVDSPCRAPHMSSPSSSVSHQ